MGTNNFFRNGGQIVRNSLLTANLTANLQPVQHKSFVHLVVLRLFGPRDKPT